ncbi:MAG TPA: hypothetical protein VNT81_03455 [Vicinamibacterales bacterium]|nr:hypothetical protein [Vicinamibacterales bacterium]
MTATPERCGSALERGGSERRAGVAAIGCTHHIARKVATASNAFLLFISPVPWGATFTT